MDTLPHTATAVPFGPNSANFSNDTRIITPLLLNTRKPLTISDTNDLRHEPGLRRQYFPGNPVIVGYVRLGGFAEGQRLCVTGDTHDQDNVTLTIQDTDQFGVYKEELQKVMSFARGYTDADIARILEVDSMMWQEQMTRNSDIEVLDIIDKRFGTDPSWVRDTRPHLFLSTIKNYVVQTIKAAREDERRHFLALARVKPWEIYERCGWLHVAVRDEVSWLKQLKECASSIMGV